MEEVHNNSASPITKISSISIAICQVNLC